MILKINCDKTVLLFQIINKKLELDHKNDLEEIITLFEDITLIDSNLPFDESVKLRAKNQKHILINHQVKTLDEYRLLVTLINNFLIASNQHTEFILESIEIPINENSIIIHGTEVLYCDLSELSLSPILRSKISNPQFFNKIISI